MLLVGRRRSQLQPQLATSLALLRHDLIQLRRELRVRLLELRHLGVGQLEALLRELGDALPKLLLERRAISASAGRVRDLRE